MNNSKARRILSILGAVSIAMGALSFAPLATHADSTEYYATEQGYIVPVSEYEIELLVQLVQCEVGNNPEYFRGYDFNLLQQVQCKLVLNRVGREGFADSVYDVICQKAQFPSLSKLATYSSTDELTRANVLTVLRGEDNISENILFQMSSTSDYSSILRKMESHVGDVDVYYYASTIDGRQIIFAG